MRGLSGRAVTAAILTVVLGASGCRPVATAPATTSTPEPASTASTADSAAPSTGGSATPAPVPVDHRIGVRVVDGAGEFFDTATGERFVPRGANLIRLSAGSHSTLDVGRYDAARVNATFAALAADGYNTVRIFLNSYPGGLPGGDDGLSSAYLDNVVDALRLAKANGLVVLLTQDWLPESADWTFGSDPMIEDVNGMYLSTAGVAMNERFFRVFTTGLVERRAPLDALFAYELRNELYFTSRYAPFSLTSGSVRTANGQTYDLSSATEQRAMLEDNLVAWIDRMRSAIRGVDPSALVTVGFFQPQGPNPSRIGDDRLIETRETITRSTADFIDLHGYPGGELNLAQVVQNYALPAVTNKPILLGEFGAEHGAFPTADDAVRALVAWQVESCAAGFDGWLVWTWDSLEQPEFWNAVEADGAIERALSPTVRPDPCVIGDLGIPFELARSATATASRALHDSAPDAALDGLADTLWSSGNDAPQWIEIDLGGERTVETIRLLVSQYPNGPSTHVVSVRGSGGTRVVSTLSGPTADGDWLTVTPPAPLAGVRYVRIETTASTSWVAWREISILGEG